MGATRRKPEMTPDRRTTAKTTRLGTDDVHYLLQDDERTVNLYFQRPRLQRLRIFGADRPKTNTLKIATILKTLTVSTKLRDRNAFKQRLHRGGHADERFCGVVKISRLDAKN